MGVEPGPPPVVVVVVACRPGPWFEESLASLAAQDYPALSLLVVSVGDDVDAGVTAARVAGALPDAHLASAPAGTSFAQAANIGVGMVQGAAHVLVCHDDVALAPSALRLLLEEAYRSNAGLTCPKAVMWDAPDRLLSVGLGADHLGVTHPLVDPGELDQGQHDAAREVFVAGGGAVLARTDLWAALGGYGRSDGSPGEELELSWRAQLAGARVVVAPQASVRHLEASTRGLRAAGGPAPTLGHLSASSERCRLRALWTCYSLGWLAVVAPVALAFLLGDSLWSAARRRGRAQVLAPFVALWWSLHDLAELRDARGRVRSLRRVSDTTVWKLQSRGSARVRAVLRPRLERGHQLAELAGSAVRGDEPPVGRLPALTRASAGTAKLSLWVAVLVVALVSIGSRDLLGGPLPVVGQLPALTGGTAGWLHSWWSGAGAGDLGGAGQASPPALMLLWAIGTVCFGSAAAAAHVLVLAPLLLGPLSAYRAVGRLVQSRARLLAVVLYGTCAVPFNAVAHGHLASLVVYVAAPWFVGWVCSLGGGAPLAAGELGWRSLLRRALALAAAASLAPVLLVLLPLAGAAMYVGYLLSGPSRPPWRLLWAPGAVAAGAAGLLSPWSWSVLGPWSALTGAPSGRALGVIAVLGMHTGPYGGGPLGLALAAAAAVPVLIARSWRLVWTGRLWVVALIFMGLTWGLSRAGGPVPESEALLAPAAACLVFVVALGMAGVRSDLRQARFGWRQLVPAAAVVAAAGAVVPALVWAGNGAWSLPAQGAEASYVFPPATAGDYRVLWVGAAGTLPLAPQGREGQVVFASSLDGLPNLAQFWPGAPGGDGRAVARELAWAQQGATSVLGRLLALAGVRYVVVPSAQVASTGEAGPAAVGVVARLDGTLAQQVDLVQVGIEPQYQVFYNADWMPLVSVVPGRVSRSLSAMAAAPTPWAAASLAVEARPGAARPLPLDGRQAVRERGAAVYAALSRGALVVTAGGRVLGAGRPAGISGTQWALPGPSALRVAPAGGLARRLGDVGSLVLWALAAWACLTRRWHASPGAAGTGALSLGEAGGEPARDGHELPAGTLVGQSAG